MATVKNDVFIPKLSLQQISFKATETLLEKKVMGLLQERRDISFRPDLTVRKFSAAKRSYIIYVTG